MSKTRLNSRQKRVRNANMSRLRAAIEANPSFVASEGKMRTSTTGAKSHILNETWHGWAKGLSHARIPVKPATIEGTSLNAHEGKLKRAKGKKFTTDGFRPDIVDKALNGE